MCEHPYSLLYKTFKPWFGFTALQDHFPHFKQSQMIRWSEYGIFPRKTTPPDLQQKQFFVSHLTQPEPEPTVVSWLSDSETVLLTCCLQGRQNCNIYMKSDSSLLKIVCASYNLFYCMNRRAVYIKKLYAISSYNLKGCVNGPLHFIFALCRNKWEIITISRYLDRLKVSTVSKKFKIILEGQNYVHFEVILSRNVKIFGIMASL